MSKDPGSPDNNPEQGSRVDSMRYTLKYEDSNSVVITSLYNFTYDKINGEDLVSKIRRTDTIPGTGSGYVNYVDKEYTYDDKGRLINIFSKSRRRDLFLGNLTGTGTVENYNIYYSFGIPNDFGFPSTIDVDVYNDSTASTTAVHDKYLTNVPYDGYLGPSNIYYEFLYDKDTAGFDDAQNVFWGGPPVIQTSSTPTSKYLWIFNQSGLVKDFLAFQTPWYYYFTDLEREDQRRVHFQYDTSLVNLMQTFIGKRTYKYNISADIVLAKYQHDLSNDDMFRGIVNQMKILSLSSTDSTIKLDNKGKITDIVEKVNTQGSVVFDAQGRVSKVIKQTIKTRTQWPLGTYHYTQTFQFYYGKIN
jgi:hypothetical protein